MIKHMKRTDKHKILKNAALFCLGGGFIIASILTVWIATVKLPDFKSFTDRKVSNSTKIYDRTGTIVLYDVHQEYKRTEIPFADMGTDIKNATVAIEDSEFYQHHGIRLKSIFRAILSNLTSGNLTGQGGSTITQQVIKNNLLTTERTLTRKLKEWVLSVKLERVMSKEDILALYLNGNPYGGSIYGIDEAARSFFGKAPKDLTLAESAYLAAIPQAPTYYSPYGSHKEQLTARKNLVLSRMKELGFITDVEYAAAMAEHVVFKDQEPTGIKAPHFVFFIKDYLEQKYGVDEVESGGLKVITTLDYDLQKKAEDIVYDYTKGPKTIFTDENAGMVAIDPKTGQILVMVGSRDYFDKEIDGNFNVTTARRQPGSSFKPFVYSAAFNMGYTAETTLFDVPTQFSAACDAYGNPIGGAHASDCYMPRNYDGSFHGPMTLRQALARSMNIPSIKLLYLVGVPNAIKTATDMGITTLTDPSRYGLSLVLGGGEVKLLDMTSAYSDFATGGLRHPYQSILSITDVDGNTLESYTPSETRVLPEQTALTITSILSDNAARTPTFGANSKLYFPGRDVAVKTGTTNEFKDSWIIGYTPSITVGAWVGKNDNTPMPSNVLAHPFWHEFMNYVLSKSPDEKFQKPDPIEGYDSLSPRLKGSWLGGESFFVDKISGGLATALTPKETKVEKVLTNVHEILYWINKDDPRGPKPDHPENDPAFYRWETGVANWWAANSSKYATVTSADKPTASDTVHTEANKPHPVITSPQEGVSYNIHSPLTVTLSNQGTYPLQKADFFVNNIYIGTSSSAPFSFSFTPFDLSLVGKTNDLKVVAYDSVYNSAEATATFTVSE